MAKRKKPPLKRGLASERAVWLAIEGNPFAIIALMTAENHEGSGRLLEQIRQARLLSGPLPASFAAEAEALYSSKPKNEATR